MANPHPVQWLLDLSSTLAETRILCGDWSRCLKPTYGVSKGLTGAFFDPPYFADCDTRTYADEASEDLSQKLLAWLIENQNHSLLRLAVCGYAGSCFDVLADHGWDEQAWSASGGLARNGARSGNKHRERVWFKNCLENNQLEEQTC
jgi:site-specific DNA-adenine methylase